MPELPEVETILQQLERALKKRRILDFEIKWPKLMANLTVEEFKRKTKNQIIERIERRGKFLLFYLKKYILIIHLRLTGRLLLRKRGAKEDDYQIACLVLSPLKSKKGCECGELRYADARKFGRFWLIQRDDLPSFLEIQKLGPDALKISLLDFTRLLQSKKTRIKAVLLDQTNLSGLGNIYTDEALFRAKIHPLTCANLFTKKQIRALYKSIQQILKQALQKRGTSDQYYWDSYGRKGKFQNYLRVYKREGKRCVRCKTHKIQYIKVNQRGTRFCPYCQKELKQSREKSLTDTKMF